MTTGWDIREAEPADWPQLEALLLAENLPTTDIDAATLRHFLVAAAPQILGVIGLEPHGKEGLVRSLVTLPAARFGGIGSALYDAMELRARASGMAQLWLLTTSAGAFFESRGYHCRDREKAPAWLTETAQFRVLCPASAHLMSKGLD